MRQETVQNYIDQYLPPLKKNPKDTQRILDLLIKEVERDTRGAACDQITALYNKVHNLDH